MANPENSYKQAFKATSIYGGVQIINVIIAIIRSKFVAILLGPAGMGIFALYTSTIGLVTGITNFGLGTAAVKNVSTVNSTDDKEQLGKTVAVFRRLVWITGGLGLLLTLIFAPVLSKIAFGNKSYTVAFMILSVTLLFTQINEGQKVILQGLRKVQYLAKATVMGAVIGLFISIPLYYFFREKGIVPAILVTSVTTLLLSWYFANKIKIPAVPINMQILKDEGRDMLKMGVLISMSSLISMPIGYIVRIFISHRGGIADVGLFSAGFTMINTYAGMVFTAMGTDYYPRLAAVAGDLKTRSEAMNQQAEIAILILAPVLIIFLVFVKFGIILLYSNDFLPIVPMMQWAVLGIFFKALSWSVAYIFLAKGDSKTFFRNEMSANVYIFAFNLLGYYYAGLTGLGVSFFAAYFIYFIQVWWVSKKLYQFRFNQEIIRVFAIQFTLALACFVVVFFFNQTVSYSVGIPLIICAGIYSWKEMEKRIGIKQIILNKLKK